MACDGREVAGDTPTLTGNFTDMNDRLEQLMCHLSLLQEYLQSSDNVDRKPDVDILELKNHLLLSYIIDLVYVVLIKCEGADDAMQQHTAAVDRLVEIRTVIEKMRPLEQKFSYQLDKLLRTASSKLRVGGEHPLQFRPVPENLVSKVVEQSGQDEDVLGEDQEQPLYVPPRVVAMPYKEVSRSLPKSQVEKSRLISELRDELTDFPSEIQNSGGSFKKRRAVKDDRMRESFEEDYMVRLTNRRKSRSVGRLAQQELEDLVDFSSLKGLTRARSQTQKRLKKQKHSKK